MSELRKIDLKKKYKTFYSERKGNISIVEVPEFKYLMCSGQGSPASVGYKNAIEALFPLAYHIKFLMRTDREVDYGVMPLERLWWMDDRTQLSKERMADWEWSAMIMQPNFITKEIVAASIKELREKKDLPFLDQIELVDFRDGLSAQIMHTGSYIDQASIIEKLHTHVYENAYEL